MTHRSFSFSPIRKRALVSSLPVMMGYIAMGFAAGVLLSTRSGVEYPALWGIFTAMTSISGTLQFLFPEWFRKGLPLAEVALLTLCINFRYAMYGFSLLEKFKGLPWWKRCYLIWTLTDETYALEVAAPYPAGKNHTLYCFTLAMLDHCYWIIGVALGAVAGSHLPFSGQGVEFAMTALFLVILTDQVREKENRKPAITGGLTAIAALLVLGPGKMLIPAIILIVTIFLVFRKKWNREAEK